MYGVIGRGGDYRADAGGGLGAGGGGGPPPPPPPTPPPPTTKKETESQTEKLIESNAARPHRHTK